MNQSKGFCGYCLFDIILRFNFDRKNENLLIDIIVRHANIVNVYAFMTILIVNTSMALLPQPITWCVEM